MAVGSPEMENQFSSSSPQELLICPGLSFSCLGPAAGEKQRGTEYWVVLQTKQKALLEVKKVSTAFYWFSSTSRGWSHSYKEGFPTGRVGVAVQHASEGIYGT